MKFSSQEEYGLRCLLAIAKGGDQLTISEISRQEGLTIHHVGKLMRLLRRGGFVKSARGQLGGYQLARSAEQILLGEVLAVLGGRLFDPSFCMRHAGTEHLCTHTSECSVRSLLKTLQFVLDGVLQKVTLQDLLRNEIEMSGFMEKSGFNRVSPLKLAS